MMRFWTTWLVWTVLGCSGQPTLPAAPQSSQATSGGAGALGTEDGGFDDSSDIPEAANTEDWQRVRASFTTLSTIAGKGQSDNLNEWQPSFEGGRARDAELSRPHIALTDAAGNVYIADKESHGIRKVTLDGTIHTVAGTNVLGNAPDTPTPALEAPLSSPNGLWIAASGNIYIVDLGNAKIRRLTPDGMLSTLLTLRKLPTGRGLWVAEDESQALIAAENELWSWSPDFGTKTLANGFGAIGMVLKTADGRILVGDRDGMRVYEVGADGSKRVIAGNGLQTFTNGTLATETGFDEPRAIWPYGEGLLVGLHDGCKIIYIDSSGYAHLMLRGSANSHRGDGEHYNPFKTTIGEMRSLTVSAQGNLVFVENDVGYVRMVSAAQPLP